MKHRSDFVANSSSTGFIVKAEEDTPEIFKHTAMSWKKFCNEYLFNYMLGSFVDACSSYFSMSSCYWSSEEARRFNIKDHISIIDDDVFIASFMTMSARRLALPKSFAHLEEDICELITVAREMENDRVQIYSAGKIDYSQDLNLHYWDRRDAARNAVSNMLKPVYDWLKERLGKKCKDWSFWVAELSDSDDEGGEAEGRNALNSPAVKWYFTESHH